MNNKGIEKFKSEIKIGDIISVNAREHSYSGEVIAIGEDCFEVDEGFLSFSIYYSHVWAYSKHE